MYYSDEKTNEYIFTLNNTIKEIRAENKDIRLGDEYKIGKKIKTIKDKGVLNLTLNKVKKKFNKWERTLKILYDKYHYLDEAVNNREECNYFFNEKIIVYTCVLGTRDGIVEPHVKPNNIEYFAITDFELPKESKWTRIDINCIEEISSLNNTLKARYIKTHPHVLFKECSYSIYIDGNFEVFSDLTEHINRLSKYYFSVFQHSLRTCVYEEIDACQLLKKDSEERLKNYLNRIKALGIPNNYGLFETGMMVRKHDEASCIKIMEELWDELKNYINRDQLALPYVLYKNGISVEEIGTLGHNIFDDLSFEILPHKRIK